MKTKTTLLLSVLLLLALPLNLVCAQAPPKSKASTNPQRMVGKWDVNHIGGSVAVWEFKDDGALAILSGVGMGTACRWQKIKDAIVVTYPDGKVSSVDWPIKNGKTQGHDAAGRKLWLTEAKK